jgi:hypothetical protein
VFLRPDDTDGGWEQTSIWTAARAIAGAHVLIDIGGSEAARFGAATSGQVLLYDPDGQLLFAGGITQSRGHQGDNPGRRRVLSLIHGPRADQRPPTNVYGCPLSDPEVIVP